MFVVGTGLREGLVLICSRLKGIESALKWVNLARSGTSEVFQGSF